MERVDKVVIAGGGCETFESAVRCLKPGGKIGNVNYLGSGTYVTVPRVEWGVGMGHKQINGGLMPGGRLRMENWRSGSAGKLDVHPLASHVFEGWDHLEEALFMMRDKPADLIKPVVRFQTDKDGMRDEDFSGIRIFRSRKDDIYPDTCRTYQKRFCSDGK